MYSTRLDYNTRNKIKSTTDNHKYNPVFFTHFILSSYNAVEAATARLPVWMGAQPRRLATPVAMTVKSTVEMNAVTPGVDVPVCPPWDLGFPVQVPNTTPHCIHFIS
jgi:hypothetical protein